MRVDGAVFVLLDFVAAVVAADVEATLEEGVVAVVAVVFGVVVVVAVRWVAKR